ncbi:MAG: ribonuclease toxin HepT-like protein [Desulfuromonadaceae bacterium]
MTASELCEEISIELEMMGNTVNEAISLLNELSVREPTVREKTAAGAFLAQFYGGVENILKRVHRYHGIQLPTGDSWHTDVFKRFCNPAYPPFPVLFDPSLAADLSPFRKFRHVVYHGYGFQFDWERMKEGLGVVDNVYSRFVVSITDYTNRL